MGHPAADLSGPLKEPLGGWGAARHLCLVLGLAGLVFASVSPVASAIDSRQVTAHDLFFDPEVIEAPAGIELSVELENAGAQPHNIAFYQTEGGSPLSPGAIGPVILAGESTRLSFVTPGPGRYFFVCDVHPLDMQGTLVVEGGPLPSGPAPASQPPAISLGAHSRIDATAFRITTFASGPFFATAMEELPDGSILVAINEPERRGFVGSQGRLVRMLDEDDDGVADRSEPVGITRPISRGGPSVYADVPGAIVQLRRHGGLLFMTSRRQQASSISILREPSSTGSPMALLASLELLFPEDHLHDTYSLAVRDEPDGSIGLYFNVGSRFEGMSDATPVGVTGLVEASLRPESVYRLPIRDDGSGVTAGQPELVAIGLRNAAGMAFHPGTGDLYLQDNGMSREDDPDESLSADELNVIPAEQLVGHVTDLGWSEAWTEYRTGRQVGERGQPPHVAFQPLDGAESEGAAGIAFAPPGFPDGLDDGLFVGFHGVYGAAGLENEENPLVYVDVSDGSYLHFVPNDLEAVGHLDYLLATDDSLYVADLNRSGRLGTVDPEGVIYQIKASPAAS